MEECYFTKSNTPPWVFFTFFNCTNGTKSCNASHIKRFYPSAPNKDKTAVLQR